MFCNSDHGLQCWNCAQRVIRSNACRAVTILLLAIVKLFNNNYCHFPVGKNLLRKYKFFHIKFVGHNLKDSHCHHISN
jgi:hypothetical protein